jgi:hypothetical protein
MDHMLEVAYLSDILPTGYHGCVIAGVRMGSTVYIAGAGPSQSLPLPPPRTHHACNTALRILSLLPSLSADLPAALVVEWILTDRMGDVLYLLRPRYNLLLSSVTINRWH